MEGSRGREYELCFHIFLTVAIYVKFDVIKYKKFKGARMKEESLEQSKVKTTFIND